MATTETDSVQDHMLRLKMKMVQQKIQNEKERIVNRPSSEASTGNDLENQARLQQAMLRRQELLDKIRREQLLNEENKRPRSYSARRRYTPSPLPVPPSRRSLPDFAKYNLYNQGAETYRSKPDMSQVKHVIEHRIKSPEHNLPPIPKQRAQPIIYQQPPPPAQLVPMQQPTPQIIAAPAPQHIFTGYQNPVIHNLGGMPEKRSGMFNKEEMGDMMMLQNAQLHQLVMQKTLMKGLGSSSDRPRHSSCSHHHGHRGHGHHHGCARSVSVPRTNGGAVHHHHYSNPPSQPAVTHYTTMPAMDIRGSYPSYRGYSSGYTGPGYTYSGYDDGDNYYTYH